MNSFSLRDILFLADNDNKICGRTKCNHDILFYYFYRLHSCGFTGNQAKLGLAEYIPYLQDIFGGSCFMDH